ncbi:hypothetical protein V2J66_14135 [Pseudomonas alliivorans]|nr:hypothetical protein [Pseudomonas alliivorans]MEE5096289.1 hypothetical protein [Pseudomonas alliivorans]
MYNLVYQRYRSDAGYKAGLEGDWKVRASNVLAHRSGVYVLRLMSYERFTVDSGFV